MTSAPASQRLKLDVQGTAVSALALAPAEPWACFVMAHGAGAGMDHPFMDAMAQGLAERGVASLRFQFPAMEKGSRRPDAPAVAQAAVRAAVDRAGALFPALPLFAGGKSFGGRMSSQAQALLPLPGVRGLVFIGFPLHPAGKPSDERARHLSDLRVPMLFLQGTRDALAAPALLEPVVRRLGSRATLETLEDADHAMHVTARSGRTDEALRRQMLDAMARWMRESAVEP